MLDRHLGVDGSGRWGILRACDSGAGVAHRWIDDLNDVNSLATANVATALPTQGWSRADWAVLAAIIVLGWLLFGWRVERRGIWSAHEGRAAQDAQSLLDGRNWALPQLFIDAPDYQKPPLYYWCVAAIAKWNGGVVDAFAVRLPAVLAAIACLTYVFVFTRQFWHRGSALLAVGVLASITRFAWLARVGRIDMPMTFCTTVALLEYWSLSMGLRGSGKWRTFIVHGATALGVLLKGPIALVLIYLPILAHEWLAGRASNSSARDRLRLLNHRLKLGVGLCCVAGVCLPWYLFAIWETRGGFFWEFVVYHNVERALGSSEGLKSGPLWFYVPRLLADAFPWSALLPAFCLSIWQKHERVRAGNDAWTSLWTFPLVWLTSHFILLSAVSFKRADYLLPLYPALALSLTLWLADRADRFEKRVGVKPSRHPGRRGRLVAASALAIVLLSTPLWVWASIEFVKKGIVRSLLKIDAVADNFNHTDRFMLDHIERLMRENGLLLAIAGCVVVACVWLFHTGWHHRLNGRVAVGLSLPWCVAFLFQIHLFLPAIDPLREMARFGSTIRYIATPEQPIYYFEKFDADLVFHAGRPARMLFDWSELAELGQQTEPRFVVIKAKDLPTLRTDARLAVWRGIADNCQTAFGQHRDPRVLLTNRPQAIADRLRATTTF